MERQIRQLVADSSAPGLDHPSTYCFAEERPWERVLPVQNHRRRSFGADCYRKVRQNHWRLDSVERRRMDRSFDPEVVPAVHRQNHPRLGLVERPRMAPRRQRFGVLRLESPKIQAQTAQSSVLEVRLRRDLLRPLEHPSVRQKQVQSRRCSLVRRARCTGCSAWPSRRADRLVGLPQRDWLPVR